MNNEPTIPLKLFSEFSDIIYHDEPHKYYRDGKQQISATTFIGLFKQKFDTESISEAYAEKNDLEVEHVVAEWDWKRDFACLRGSMVHKYAEDYFNCKIFPYPEKEMTQLLGFDNVKSSFNNLIKQIHKFREDSKENLIMVKPEMIVGDRELNICGMVDCLFFNRKSGMFEIYDYKTNKKMRMKPEHENNRYKHPISHLGYYEMNTYSLQLSLYKYIIERNTGLKLGNSYVIWFNEGNPTYKLYKCFDYRDEIESMIQYAKQNKIL